MIFKPPSDNLKEKDIETRLVREVKKLGGMCEKFTSPNKRSVPDRLCSFSPDITWYVECKAPRKKPTEKQAKDHKKRRSMGFRVDVVDTYEAVDKLIVRMKRFINESALL